MYCSNCGTKLQESAELCHICNAPCIAVNTPLLKVINLCKDHKNNFSLKDISFTINSGEFVAVLGDNGSGKSTLMSIIAGMNNFDSGQILFDDKAINKASKKFISYVPQEPILIDDLSVKDNLRLWQGIYYIKDFKTLLSLIPDFLGIDKMLKKKVSTLSGGMKKKLSFAIALINKPRLLILDEPYAALDSHTIDCLNEYLSKLQGVSLLYSSHDVNEVSKLCKRAIIIKDGKITQS